MEVTWWEKTVEYAFVVAAFIEKKCDLAAPLAGKHERAAGDAVFAQASKFVLIEFKKDKTQISNEQSLFMEYKEAKEKLKVYKHHFIVYGSVPTNEHEQLQLKVQHYFDETSLTSALSCLENGIEKNAFFKYLEELASFKFFDKRSGSGGGHIRSKNMQTVIGVSATGKMIGSSTIQEYAPTLFPLDTYADENNDEPAPSPTSAHRI